MASNSKKTPKKPLVTAPAAESPPAAAPVPSSPSSDFRAEIEKSRALIADADQAPAELTTKNKGGRPSNAEKAQREAAEKAARLAELQRLVPTGSLKAAVAMPFDLAALATGFTGFRLEPEEADAIVPSLHEVLVAYAPQVKGENLALVTLAGALFSIGIGKYLAYLHHARQEGGTPAGAGSEAPPETAPASNEKPATGQFFPPGVHIS